MATEAVQTDAGRLSISIGFSDRPDPPTERQIGFLRDLGETRKPASKIEASEMIDRLVAPIQFALNQIYSNAKTLERPDERKLTLAIRHSDYYSQLSPNGKLSDDLRLKIVQMTEKTLDAASLGRLKQRRVAKKKARDSARDISFNCPHCGRRLVVNIKGAGLIVACPLCDKNVFVNSVLANERAAR